jgi:hypothetical protein
MASKSTSSSAVWPERDHLECGTYTVDAASARLGIGRQLAYSLIRRGEFPTPVIYLGSCDGSGAARRIVIPKAPLDALLGGSAEPDKDCEK